MNIEEKTAWIDEDSCHFHPDSDHCGGGLFRLPDAGKRVCLYCRLAADHDLHVLHRPHGGQPVSNRKIHECGHELALFPHATVLRGHHSGGSVSGRAESRFRVDAPWRGDQAVEIRIHGML